MSNANGVECAPAASSYIENKMTYKIKSDFAVLG